MAVVNYKIYIAVKQNNSFLQILRTQGMYLREEKTRDTVKLIKWT